MGKYHNIIKQNIHKYKDILDIITGNCDVLREWKNFRNFFLHVT